MEFKYGKHVKVVVDLKIGDEATIEGWGYELDGKVVVIEDIRFTPGRCQTSVQVKISGYKNYIDSDWVTKK